MAKILSRSSRSRLLSKKRRTRSNFAASSVSIAYRALRGSPAPGLRLDTLAQPNPPIRKGSLIETLVRRPGIRRIGRYFGGLPANGWFPPINAKPYNYSNLNLYFPPAIFKPYTIFRKAPGPWMPEQSLAFSHRNQAFCCMENPRFYQNAPANVNFRQLSGNNTQYLHPMVSPTAGGGSKAKPTGDTRTTG